jgi:two-component system phosphate regulon response regulator PhoB
VAKIIAIDPDPDTREAYCSHLAREGHEVRIAGTARAGLEAIRSERADLILMDLEQPDTDGNELLRTLKRDKTLSHAPVIVVSGRAEEIDRIVAFELGADDFVGKPFSPRELALRARAVLRRSEGTERDSDALQDGRLRVDRLAHRVWVDSEPLELSLLEFRILGALFDQRARVRTREELLDTVWGPDSGVSVRSVDAYVKRLRKKLGRARYYIETVRGVGYRLAAPRRQ